VSPFASEDPGRGVELEMSSAASQHIGGAPETSTAGRPFEFLEHARVESLVPYLSREHGQTIAIVLSYLAPARAAQVLAALPSRLQTEAVERLSVLGEIDPTSVEVVERELANWMARQRASRSRDVRSTDTISAILAAADDSTRGRILANVGQHNRQLAERIAPPPVKETSPTKLVATSVRQEQVLRRMVPPPKPRPTMPFENLTQLDKTALSAVLRGVDAEVLVLALAGASDALIERIAVQMPRATAAVFRRRLLQLGPTRLSDVEAAQREVACVAAQAVQFRSNGKRAIAS
jgi:flagellar motor switch protein FliG